MNRAAIRKASQCDAFYPADREEVPYNPQSPNSSLNLLLNSLSEYRVTIWPLCAFTT